MPFFLENAQIDEFSNIFCCCMINVSVAKINE